MEPRQQCELGLGGLHLGDGEVVINIEEQVAQTGVERAGGDGDLENVDLRIDRIPIGLSEPASDAGGIEGGDIRPGAVVEESFVAEGFAAVLNRGPCRRGVRDWIQRGLYAGDDGCGIGVGGIPLGECLAEGAFLEHHVIRGL